MIKAICTTIINYENYDLLNTPLVAIRDISIDNVKVTLRWSKFAFCCPTHIISEIKKVQFFCNYTVFRNGQSKIDSRATRSRTSRTDPLKYNCKAVAVLEILRYYANTCCLLGVLYSVTIRVRSAGEGKF